MKSLGIDCKSTTGAVDQSQRCLLEFRDDQTIALPRIFAQLLDALRQLHGTAKLDGLEARLIHQLDDRHHHPGAHVISPQALLAVAQGRVDETNFSHKFSCSAKAVGIELPGRIAAETCVIESAE